MEIAQKAPTGFPRVKPIRAKGRQFLLVLGVAISCSLLGGCDEAANGLVIAPELLKETIAQEFKASLAGRVMAFVVIAAGVWLIFQGIEGESSFSIQGMGLDMDVSSSIPGVIVAFIGFLIFRASRPKVVLKNVIAVTADQFRKFKAIEADLELELIEKELEVASALPAPEEEPMVAPSAEDEEPNEP